MDAERAELESLLRVAEAAGRPEAIAKARKALSAYDAKTAPATPSTRPPPAPQAPKKGLIRRGIDAFTDEAKREARTIGVALGIVDPGPQDQELLDQLETFAVRGANAFTLGGANRIADAAIGPGARLRREELYTNPANQKAGLVGDIAGGLASSVIGPAGIVGGAARAVTRGVGGAIARQAPKLAARVAARPGLATGATAAIEGAAVNTVHNAIDPDAVSLTQGLELPVILGLASGGLSRGAAAVNKGLQGRSDSPTWIGRYRNYAESERGLHAPVRNAEFPGSLRDEPRIYELEGLPPHPNDVFNAGVARGRVPEMRDVRDAAEEAAGQAMQHRATKARTAFDDLEAQAQPYLATRANRQALIDDIDRQIAANTDPNLGVVSESRNNRLLAVRQKLVESTPAKRPVIEGARVPTTQAELPSPGAPPVTLPPEPMSLPAAPPPPARQRVMFPDEPAALGENATDHQLRALLASAERDAAEARKAVPRLPGERSRVVTRQNYTASSQRAFDAANRAAEVRNLSRMKPFVKVEPDLPPMEPPQRWVQADPTAPPDPNVGRQLEIDVPSPRTLPGVEPVPGPGPYQRELPGMDLPPEFRALTEAMGDPTIGGLRRLRSEARQRAGFESREPPTPAQQAARDEYFIYDRAIKNAAPEEYLALEGQMAETAKGYRREGDLLAKTEGNLVSGGGGDVAPRAHVGPDDLGAMVDEDIADRVSEIAQRPRGAGRQRARTAKQQGVATFMQRAGDENVPGKNARGSIEDLAARDPEYARLFQMVEDAKSIEAVRPGLRALLPMDLSGAVAAGGTREIVRQNLRALGARLPPVLESVEKTAPRAGMLVPALRDPLDALLVRLAAEREQQNERTRQRKGPAR